MDRNEAIAVLDVLASLAGNPVSEKTLKQYVNNKVPMPLSVVDHAGLLSDMKARGWIDRRINDFDERCWYITEAGQVVRSKHG